MQRNIEGLGRKGRSRLWQVLGNLVQLGVHPIIEEGFQAGIAAAPPTRHRHLFTPVITDTVIVIIMVIRIRATTLYIPLASLS